MAKKLQQWDEEGIKKEDRSRCGRTGNTSTNIAIYKENMSYISEEETIVKTDCNRNAKHKEYSKCDKNNYKVCEMMFLCASQLFLTLLCFFFE